MYLGIELGSTLIKAVIIDSMHKPIASGEYTWENRYENGIWTYPIDTVFIGMREALEKLNDNGRQDYENLHTVSAMGVSAMMHGYLVFDKDNRLLVPFRTWRNTFTGQASGKLTELFSFNVPQRWSIAHLYQAILNSEEHVKDIAFITTLAGYVHWQLTGEKVVGVGDASGMFPIDSETNDYESTMLKQYDTLIADKGYPWKLKDILPKIKLAGDKAGYLTTKGAELLGSDLIAGIPMAPPEGDAGTGMTATNAVARFTGNVSAGTSIFSMVVLETPLSKVYPEIDMVTTPTGKPVAMVHCNNCTSDMNAWVNIFDEFSKLFGIELTTGELFTKLYEHSLLGDADCGNVMVNNYLSGEPITDLTEGKPFVVRDPDSRFNLANFFRAQLYSCVATLKIGMDILASEHVKIECLMGHGGLFKTPIVGQRYLAAAIKSPVSVMETAGEGGPYGMALLVAYMMKREMGERLEDYLAEKVFANVEQNTITPKAEDVVGFENFMKKYKAYLEVERAAILIK